MRRPFAALLLVAGCQPDIADLKPADVDPPIPVDTDVAVALDVPDIEVTPDEIRFASLPLECITDPETVTITNVGTADLHLSDVVLKGAGTGAFTLDLPRNATIPPGGSRVVDLSFVPHQRATYEPKLVIESDDPDEGTVRVNVWGEGSDAAFEEEVFVQSQAAGVDVLWLVDNSGSMDDELGRLGRSFDAFISTFVTLGLDYHVAVAAASDEGTCALFRGPVITNAMSQADAVIEFDRQAELQSGCGEESGFDGARGALADPTNQATGFLRADATLAVVAVSDEEEQASDNITAANFATWLASLKGGDATMVSFSALTGPDGNGGIFPIGCPLASGSDAEPAPRYHAAIRATQGVWGDICHLDVRPFLQHLSYVAAGLDYRFTLGTQPIATTPDAITVTVDGVEVPYGILDGWTYDAATNSIELHGSAIADPGAVVVIRYPFDAGC